VQAYKKMQTLVKTSRIVALEEEYAVANRGIKFLVGGRDLSKSPREDAHSAIGDAGSAGAASAPSGGKPKKRAGTVILPFSLPSSSKTSSSASAPPSPSLAGEGNNAQAKTPEQKEATQNLLKSM
jgi:hypothetical protein